MLAGAGVDILAVARVQRELLRADGGLADAVFTAAELDASRRTRWPHRHLARCFAAKEALWKALGTGWRDGLGWQEVELALDGQRAELRLSGAARQAVGRRGVCAVHVDTCCGAGFAVAAVLLERPAGAAPPATPDAFPRTT